MQQPITVTLKSLLDSYKDSPVADDIKEIHALAATQHDVNLARINAILRKYEGSLALHDLGRAAKIGFASAKSAPDPEVTQRLEGISSSLQALIGEVSR